MILSIWITVKIIRMQQNYNFLVSDTDLSDLSKADSLPEGYGNIRIALTKEKSASEDSDSLKTGEIHTAANNAANYKSGN